MTAPYLDMAGALGAVLQAGRPPLAVKQRLLGRRRRFEAFAECCAALRRAALWDLTLDRARELLGLIDRPASWVAQIPGIRLVDFEGGPAAAAADRASSGSRRARCSRCTRTWTREPKIVLAGRVRDATSHRILGPGDTYVQAEGTIHSLIAVGDEDCISAVRAIQGIAIGGMRARPVKN
jgi:hypothetical protein